MMINKHNQLLFECIAASYLYYHMNRSIMTDHEYDQKMLDVRENWNKISNITLQRMIDLEMLKTSTSLYYIKDYPQGLCKLARKWYDIEISSRI